MKRGGSRAGRWSARRAGASSPYVLVATILRGNGTTGVETHARETLENLEGAGAHGELVTPFSWANPLASLVFAPRVLLDKLLPAVGVAWNRWSHAAFLRAALSRRLRDRSDVVVYAQCPVSALAALRARHSPAQRVVLAVHFNLSQADEWADRGMIRRGGLTYRSIQRLEKRVLTSVDGLVFVSQAALAEVRSTVAGTEHVPAAVIPNFRCDDVQVRDPGLQPPADLVTVGSLQSRKNHIYLVEVIAEAAKLGRRCSLDIIGEGETRQSLVDLAQQLGVLDDIHFLGSQSNPRALMPGYKLYVHTALQEAFGIVLIEAMAAGLPVLAGRVGGVPEVLDEGRAGWFWPLDDPAAAARILVGHLNDPDGLARAGKAARARFLDCYTSQRVVPALVEFLVSPTSSPAADAVNGVGTAETLTTP
jgi:glycosyltransferase involved in cell wall biosynthesis